MARLFFPSSADSVTCKRCGNDVPRDADTCPHCGADRGQQFPAAQTAKAATFAAALRLPFAARREALRLPSPYPSVPEEGELAGAGAGEQRWDVSKTIALGAVAVALVAGGVIYLQHGDNDASRSETPAGHSAYGVIDIKTAHDTPAAVAGPAPAPVPAGKSAASGRQAPAAPSLAARETLPADTSGHPAAALASATDNLQATRDAIDHGDLSAARRRFSKIPQSQMSAPNVQRTQADLLSLEHARDEMLQAARSCEATGSWQCVRQSARDVLAFDASNVEAQTLVEHAIARSGWLNKTAPATTAAHGAPHSNAQTVATASPAPVPVPGPRAAAAPPTHRSTTTISAAQHARNVAAMGAPPITATVPAPVVATTTRTPATASVAPRAAPEPTRVETGSQAPLTSQAYTPPPPPPPQQAAPSQPPVAAFVPMPDGPGMAPAPASVRNAPASAAPRAPTQPEPEPATAAQVPGDIPAAPPVVRTLAPVTEAVPVRAGIVSPPVSPPVAANMPPAGVQNSARPPSPPANRTLASGENTAGAAQPRASRFNAANPDDEERAILESGWSKSPSSAQRPAPQ